ncbi:hypothetical protein NPIL_429531 [Nephila pilipes]|uniref:Uncharacterized protein n=1 Tax=Nephila pilipes TaxID=299642 RepID=A0A8X6NVP7_NEPPI|nr:hypothetical protein NPIL_614581 [Nephila pilipes]GFT33846.1 hypothetical protein NPIL_429531 [Nephila pilipes]
MKERRNSKRKYYKEFTLVSPTSYSKTCTPSISNTETIIEHSLSGRRIVNISHFEAEVISNNESRVGFVPTTHIKSTIMWLVPKYEKDQGMQLFLKLFKNITNLTRIPEGE